MASATLPKAYAILTRFADPRKGEGAIGIREKACAELRWVSFFIATMLCNCKLGSVFPYDSQA